MMSWARSTVANLEHKLGGGEDYFGRILVGVLLLIALAIVLVFAQ
jgi:hypothetical protein